MLFCDSALWSSSTFFIPSSTYALCLLVPCCCQPTSSSSIYSQRRRPPSRKCFAAIAKFAIQMWNYSSAPSSISSFLPLLAQMSWLVLIIFLAKIFTERSKRGVLFYCCCLITYMRRNSQCCVTVLLNVMFETLGFVFSVRSFDLWFFSGNCAGGDASFSGEGVINSGQA